jgi:hypothetical protein
MGSPATRIQGEDASGVVQEMGMVGEGLKVSGGFIPSDYDTDLTMNGTAQGVVLATGATKVQFANLGATTEAIRVAFGTSELDAEGNLNIAGGLATTGYYIPAAADAGGASVAVLDAPVGSTHYAVANAVLGDTQTVAITQGT